jgi:hypothetical protein
MSKPKRRRQKMVWRNFVNRLAITSKRRGITAAVVYGLSLGVRFTSAGGGSGNCAIVRARDHVRVLHDRRGSRPVPLSELGPADRLSVWVATGSANYRGGMWAFVANANARRSSSVRSETPHSPPSCRRRALPTLRAAAVTCGLLGSSNRGENTCD